MTQINDKYDVQASSEPPDVEALERAMRGEVLPVQGELTGDAKELLRRIEDAIISNNNSLIPTFQKSDRDLGMASFIYPPPTDQNKIFSDKIPRDYSLTTKVDEAEILARLDKLLCENEVSGLDESEMAELAALQRKVR